MVGSFKFAVTPEIIFGSGKRSALTSCIKIFGSQTLLITGEKSLVSSPFWEEIISKLSTEKVKWEHETIIGEPSPEIIDRISNQYNSKQIDCIVAIGGGSVLDAGKAISAMIGKKESVVDFLEGVGSASPDGSKIPFIALPTTSGTGSECTKNAVISRVGKNGFKKSLRHDNFVPNVAIVDPELTLMTPSNVTASSGMDAFTQLLESYLSNAANEITDALAIDALDKIRTGLPAVMKDGSNLKGREAMSYAAMISGITLANAGLGTVHGFASSIGGLFNIPHGVICGTLMGACNDQTVKSLKGNNSDSAAFNKYAKVGKLFSRKAHKSEAYHIEFLLELIHRWTEKFKIPTLSKFGVDKSAFQNILSNTSNKNNPVDLNQDQLIEILEKRL